MSSTAAPTLRFNVGADTMACTPCTLMFSWSGRPFYRSLLASAQHAGTEKWSPPRLFRITQIDPPWSVCVASIVKALAKEKPAGIDPNLKMAVRIAPTDLDQAVGLGYLLTARIDLQKLLEEKSHLIGTISYAEASALSDKPILDIDDRTGNRDARESVLVVHADDIHNQQNGHATAAATTTERTIDMNGKPEAHPDARFMQQNAPAKPDCTWSEHGALRIPNTAEAHQYLVNLVLIPDGSEIAVASCVLEPREGPETVVLGLLNEIAVSRDQKILPDTQYTLQVIVLGKNGIRSEPWTQPITFTAKELGVEATIVSPTLPAAPKAATSVPTETAAPVPSASSVAPKVAQAAPTKLVLPRHERENTMTWLSRIESSIGGLMRSNNITLDQLAREARAIDNAEKRITELKQQYLDDTDGAFALLTGAVKILRGKLADAQVQQADAARVTPIAAPAKTEEQPKPVATPNPSSVSAIPTASATPATPAAPLKTAEEPEKKVEPLQNSADNSGNSGVINNGGKAQIVHHHYASIPPIQPLQTTVSSASTGKSGNTGKYSTSQLVIAVLATLVIALLSLVIWQQLKDWREMSVPKNTVGSVTPLAQVIPRFHPDMMVVPFNGTNIIIPRLSQDKAINGLGVTGSNVFNGDIIVNMNIGGYQVGNPLQTNPVVAPTQNQPSNPQTTPPAPKAKEESVGSKCAKHPDLSGNGSVACWLCSAELTKTIDIDVDENAKPGDTRDWSTPIKADDTVQINIAQHCTVAFGLDTSSAFDVYLHVNGNYVSWTPSPDRTWSDANIDHVRVRLKPGHDAETLYLRATRKS